MLVLFKNYNLSLSNSIEKLGSPFFKFPLINALCRSSSTALVRRLLLVLLLLLLGLQFLVNVRLLCGGNIAIFSWWDDASKGIPVKDQHGRAALKTWITSLALPISVARFSQRHVAIGVLITKRWNKLVWAKYSRFSYSFIKLTMLLAAFHVLGPVTTMSILVV